MYASSTSMICPLKGGHITVEAVGPGHPDKVCDQISDAVLDAALAGDPGSRVAIETAAKSGITVFGEMTTSSMFDIADIARRVHREIGYRDDEIDGVHVDVVRQSPDIALINDPSKQGAGDQGIMVGYAVNTPEHGFMPIAYALAQRLVRRLKEMRESGTLPFLRPDTKSQVVMKDGRVEHVTIATQHIEDIELEELRRAVHEHVIVPVVGDISPQACTINGTGKFVLGGPAADAGLTGRKIVVDAYGPWVPVGGGAYSGKDPTKVDRTAAYMARRIAKTIVARGMAEEAMVTLAFTINGLEPDSINVQVFGAKEPNFDFVSWIRENFPLTPGAMIEFLGLTRPSGWSYRDTAAFGHYGRPEFPWEQVS